VPSRGQWTGLKVHSFSADANRLMTNDVERRVETGGVDDRRFLPGHHPQREDPPSLPSSRPPPTRRGRPSYRVPPILNRPDPDRSSDPPVPGPGHAAGRDRSVLRAPDQTTRSQLIAAHLTRWEEALAETQRAVASLRDLLQHPPPSAVIEHRRVPAAQAAAITSTVKVTDLAARYQGQSVRFWRPSRRRASSPAGLPAGSTPRAVHRRARGCQSLSFPMTGEVRPVGRVGPISVFGGQSWP
jgi:hypothetical protein